MKQPAFWSREHSFLGWLLAPLGWMYALLTRLRLLRGHPYQPGVPLICIGNINVGGTGKTPVTLALAELFFAAGKQVYFLNHGYKSKLQGILVDMRTHRGGQVSDEALLMATKAPTIVDKNRGRGVAKAESLGADVILMDDGFQNPSVIKTLSLLVFDGQKGIGNGRCLPAGPLREPLAQGLKRADGVIIIGRDETGLTAQVKALAPDMPILKGHVEPALALKGIRGIAFAGIGQPEKFFRMLENEGVTLVRKIAYPDHYAYRDEEVEALIQTGLPVLTTAKDAVKIPDRLKAHLTQVDISFVLDNKKEWLRVLEEWL